MYCSVSHRAQIARGYSTETSGSSDPGFGVGSGESLGVGVGDGDSEGAGAGVAVLDGDGEAARGVGFTVILRVGCKETLGVRSAAGVVEGFWSV